MWIPQCTAGVLLVSYPEPDFPKSVWQHRISIER